MQLDLNFGPEQPNLFSGTDSWREQRKTEMEDLAQRAGLPLGHRVRLEMCNGVELVGRLVLAEENLFIDAERPKHLQLRIGTVDFGLDEIAGCVRLDEGAHF